MSIKTNKADEADKNSESVKGLAVGQRSRLGPELQGQKLIFGIIFRIAQLGWSIETKNQQAKYRASSGGKHNRLTKLTGDQLETLGPVTELQWY